MPDNYWFYAIGEDKIGPITQAEILKLIDEKTIDANTLVWRSPMKEWIPIGQVKELEDEIIETQLPLPWEDEPISDTTDFTKPEEEPVDQEDEEDKKDPNKGFPYQENFFSIKGRIRRRAYILRALFLGVPAYALSYYMEEVDDFSVLIFIFILIIILSILQIMQFVKRLHDINMSGWYWLIQLIPIINLIFGLYVIFKDGTSGLNEYGPDPKGRI